MSVFLALVKNDLGVAKNRKKHNSFWRKLYMALALVCGVVLYTVLLFYENVTPDFIRIAPTFLIFAYFASTLGLVKREWQGNTVGWWLSLPYSRRLLLGAKLTAGFIRLLQGTVTVLVISVLLWLEGMILRPDIWNHYSMPETFMEMGRMYAVMLSVSPLMMIFGMLIFTVRYSRFSPATPLCWIMYSLSVSFLFSTFFSTTFNMYSRSIWKFAIPGLSLNMTYVLGIMATLIIAFLLFLLAEFILEKHVEV